MRPRARTDYAAFQANVDARMRALIDTTPAGPAREAAAASIDAGGKRLRPILVLAARHGSADDLTSFARCAEHAGAAVELVHTACLVHDDVLDDASIRRGASSIRTAYGRATATATGDLLFALAGRTLTDTRAYVSGDVPRAAVVLLAEVAQLLAEGEALQADQQYDTSIDVSQYLRRCAGKTGVLFRAALELGAIFSGAPEDDRARIGAFGEALGIAFQLADDVLDFGDDVMLLGKLPGADLRDGTITLPMLYALEHDPSLATILSRPVEEAEVPALLARVRATGAVEAARTHALATRDRALIEHAEVLDRFQPHLLHGLADRTVERIAWPPRP
jgi:geranylgeranyl pyrophosphate synthase